MLELQKVRITKVRIVEIRIIDVFCSKIFKGPENFAGICRSSNYTSSNQTVSTVYYILYVIIFMTVLIICISSFLRREIQKFSPFSS